MGFFGKLKGIGKKWYILLALILVLAVGGSVAAKVYFHRNHQSFKPDMVSSLAAREVFLDLLYLEKFDTLKITPEQAKAILPLADQLNASDVSAQTDLAKQIYAKLSPVQYQALEGRQELYPGNDFKERGKRGFNGRDFRDKRDFGKDYRNRQSPREAALNDVVINMLKERSTEQSMTPAPTP